ncbi:hypothetical protein N658DRAFT_401864, partial [Parathielavia hyrcaniae]
ADIGLSQNHLANIFNALASVDRRLSRIETALKIPNFSSANPVGAAPSATASPANPAARPTQAGQPLPPAPPHQQRAAPPQPQQLSYAHQQQPSQPAVVLPGNNNPTTFAPLEPPPEGYTVTSRASMQEELDQWTLPRGYSMRIAGAKVTGKRKVRWVCFRGGEARVHHRPQHQAAAEESAAAAALQRARAEGRRKPTTDRASKKCGCPFRFEVVETARDSDVWALHYPNEEHKVHNHGPSDTASDPRARKLPAYMSAEVDAWLRDGWLVGKIQEELRARGFTNVLNTDLYNRKRLLKREGE